jgi:hypothetical protein
VDIAVRPARNNSRRLDFTSRFEASDAPVEIMGTPDRENGFGDLVSASRLKTAAGSTP